MKSLKLMIIVTLLWTLWPVPLPALEIPPGPPDRELDKFIKSTIDGKGGEVEAYLVECQVAKELIYKQSIGQSNCYNIYNQAKGKFSRSMA